MMTVEANNKRITIRWEVFALVIGIIVGGGGVFYGWAQSEANADHKVIIQREQMNEDAIVKDEAIIASNTFSISDMKTDMAAIKESSAENGRLLRDLIGRLK